MHRTIFSAVACCQILLTAIANGQVSPAVNRGSGRLAEGTGPSEVEMRLWPNGAPGLAADTAREITFIPDADIGRRVTKVTDPILTVYRPEASRATGAAVLICPGGGYNILAVVHEGIDVARWLNQLGVTGIVLQYRVPRSQTEPFQKPPLQDVQRAMSMIRQHAEEWKLDPHRVGVLGFSAGGNLAALASTNYSEPAYERVDETDEWSRRPDFSLLIYPAYLSAEDSPLTLRANLPVTDDTPPAFLVHTEDDGLSCENSIAYFLALRGKKIPATLHLYPRGGHGYGLRPSPDAVSTWPDRAERWLRDLGILDRPQRGPRGE